MKEVTSISSAVSTAVNQPTMTSKALHAVVYEATGKFEKLSAFHKKVLQVLINHHDSLQESSTKDERGYVSYYNLSELHCNMIMASIDVNHLEAVSRVFVEVKANLEAFKVDHIHNGNIAMNQILVAKAFGFTGNQALLSADKATKTLTGYSPLAAMGHTNLIAEDNFVVLTPTQISKEIGVKSAQAVNKLLLELGFQTKLAKTWQATDLGLMHAELKDTNKKRGDGTPVKQLFWKSSVLEVLMEYKK
jgi:hypothetical protein